MPKTKVDSISKIKRVNTMETKEYSQRGTKEASMKVMLVVNLEVNQYLYQFKSHYHLLLR